MSAAPYAQRHEDHFEPEHGLPERLPAHEHMLWQGSPDWRLLARRVFHGYKLALYFGVILLWRLASLLSDGASTSEVLGAMIRLVPLFVIGLGLLGLLAWLTARTTVYTLTDRRVVLRVGIVLTVTYNLPLRSIDAAHVLPLKGGHGEIALALKPGTRIAYLHLWPHVRPWHFAATQPMLRCLSDVQPLAERLARAWSLANQQPAQAAASANGDRAMPGVRQPALARF